MYYIKIVSFTELAPQQLHPQVSLWRSETTFLCLTAGRGMSAGKRPELGSQSTICDIQHHHCGTTFLGDHIDFSRSVTPR